MPLVRSKDLPTVESWTQASVLWKIYWHSKTHTLNFKQTKTFAVSKVLHAGVVGGQAQLPFQAPYKDLHSNSNCESLASPCSDIWGIFHSLFVESQLSAPPAKIGILSISGAISTQTLPKRLKLDKPTFVRHQHQGRLASLLRVRTCIITFPT